MFNDLLENHIRILEKHKKALKKLNIETVRDLFYYFPFRYGNTSSTKRIDELQEGDNVVVFGTISKLKTRTAFRRKIPMAEAVLEDDTGNIKIIWFRQPYLAKMLSEKSTVRIEGKVSDRKGILSINNPKIESVVSIPDNALPIFGEGKDNHHLYPVYPETRGLTSNWIFHAISKLISRGVLEDLVDSIPKKILEKYHLPSLHSAIIWIHMPKKESDAKASRKRFAFEEIFFIQLDRQKEKYLALKEKTFKVKKDPKEVEKFVKSFPFPLTGTQERVIGQIFEDFKKGNPMSRLLEGDVGSGKTAVAAITSFAVVTTNPPEQSFGNLQVAYMAPTEILAKQHFESFIEYFSKYKLQVGLLTSSGAKKFPSKISDQKWTKVSKNQLLKWVENGEIPILIGTHSLIQKTVKFKNLAYIIIDEQHRFGVRQRMELRRKHDIVPHFLSMTATPIPRTLSLTIFGDLDLSLLDEMPAGRKPIITEIVTPKNREKTYEFIRRKIKAGRQAYVVCPRIDEPDPEKKAAIIAKSVKEEARRLKKENFPEYEIGILHGKMKSSEKEEVMNDFKEKKIDILVATSVIEVGVNVPNSTMIIIEGAERFGLAQLHQLRGRVVRSSHQAYCFVFTDSKSTKTRDRLKALESAKNGFELAEADLEQRGAGDLSGLKQWGISDLAMEALRNIKMVEAAREEAKKIIEKDFELKKYPFLKERLLNGKNVHLE